MTTHEKPTKPVPTPDEMSQPFFEGAADDKLVIQKCNSCPVFLWPLKELCTECLSEDLKWEAVSGSGTVHSFVIMHRLFHPGFQDDVPYNLTVVELAEGPRVTTILRNVENEDIHVGLKVQAGWEIAGETSLLHFKPQ